MDDTPRPRRGIRRFDIFAEYQKDEALREGRPLAEAKGHGLWLAKVVAGRRYGAGAASPAGTAAARTSAATQATMDDEPSPFRSVGGVPQTDALFDREIVARMGEEFYRAVFAPAVERAFKEGKTYEAIRDVLRKDWKP